MKNRFVKYDDMQVIVLQKTLDPVSLINFAASITMKQQPKNNKNKKLPYNLLKMGHTSLFEHVNYTFYIVGVSRSLLTQLTRHRIASFTAGSQHYQKYNKYPAVMTDEIKDWGQNQTYKRAIEYSIFCYNGLIASGVPHHEARQILPNAMTTNILLTINARSLINFLNLRLCKRNTAEIIILAKQILKKVEEHFPELFCYVREDCKMTKCKQGRLRPLICKKKQKAL